VIDNARLQIAYSRITAPLSGRIGLRQVDPGNIVQASDTTGLVVITQLQPIAVIFAIPEDNLPSVMDKLQHGDTLVVDAYDRAGRTKLASGTLLTVDNQIDAATGTVKLKAQFSNDDFHLFPNQFVNVRMLLDVKHGATLIPTAGVQRGTQGTFVYAIKADNTVTMRPVKLGPTEGEVTAIDSGLKPGEQVVIDGSDKLREGATVEPIGKDAAIAPAEGQRQHGGRRHREGGANAPAN
jgi:multidrug efflux system membrane fusion protein